MINSLKALFNSRKFWTLIFDMVISLAIFFVGKYSSPDTLEMAKYVIAAIQPVFLFVIAGIAFEDGMAKRAGTFEGR